MDRLVDIIVRLMALVAHVARWLPWLHYERWREGQRLKVLLVGYNGARNTGADVRVAALIDQLDEALGQGAADFSVMTLDPSSTDAYLHNHKNVRSYGVTAIFFHKVLAAVSSHHVVVLCEGSMLKSKFANGLTLFMCEAAGVARAQGKPCVAYGGEVGDMDAFVERTARKLCRDVEFYVRTPGSLDALHALGMEGRLGTDTAWTFDVAAGSYRAKDLLASQGVDGSRPILGVAAINPFCWPAVPSLTRTVRSALTGRWEMHYQKWYFFSWSDERAASFDAYLEQLARAIEARRAATGCQVVLIGMEKLDAQACERLAGMLTEKPAVMLARDHNGYVISSVLAQLDCLVTSRYHASVLAMMSGVPAVAVSMDERLANLYHEAELPERLLLGVDDPDLATEIGRGLAHIDANRVELVDLIARYRASREAMTRQMAAWFCGYLEERLR